VVVNSPSRIIKRGFVEKYGGIESKEKVSARSEGWERLAGVWKLRRT